jgi:hypothetical protein
MSSLLRPPGGGTGSPAGVTDAPPAFTRAVASLRDATVRADAVVREAPAPARLAPHTYACTVDLSEHATGRLVYLHDPEGQPAWSGHDRLVAFARVEVEPAMAADPMLSDVVWTWLIESLDDRAAVYAALGGTVTTTASYRYGTLAHVAPQHEVELRCSWTPVERESAIRTIGSRAGEDGLDLEPHLAALVATLADMCGLPPDVPGVVGLPTT